MNQKELYLWGRNELEKTQIQEASIKARKLLEFILKQTRNQMICNELEEVNLKKQKEYKKQIEKIRNGVPIQYITHVQEFMGLEFYVDENVLIPQPDTEIVVETAIKLIKNNSIPKEFCYLSTKSLLEKQNTITILDLCTGSGCIGISLAKNITNAKIILSDVQEKALEIAQKNAISNQVQQKIQTVQSNLFNNLTTYQFDMIISNPPYIETNKIPMLSKEVQNEPKIALDGGKSGLFFYEKILEQAQAFLKPHGNLVLEIGYNQAPAILAIAEQRKQWKIVTIQPIKDLGGNDRVLVFQKDKK